MPAYPMKYEEAEKVFENMLDQGFDCEVSQAKYHGWLDEEALLVTTDEGEYLVTIKKVQP